MRRKSLTVGDYFKCLLNLVIITSSDTHGVYLEEENPITAAEIFLLATGVKVAGVGEMRRETFKTWIGNK